MSDQNPLVTLTVEVAYAEPNRQFLRRVELAAGATVAQAIAASDLEKEWALDAASLRVGIWSKPIARDTPLEDGDRVELYRPLKIDPKEARRQRATHARDVARKGGQP